MVENEIIIVYEKTDPARFFSVAVNFDGAGVYMGDCTYGWLSFSSCEGW